MQRRRFLQAAAGFTASLFTAVSHAQARPGQTGEWSVLDLGALGDAGQVNGLNNRGQVVGRSNAGGDSASMLAMLWDGGEQFDLGDFGIPDSSANAINDSGQIVGSTSAPDGSRHPFLWQNGTLADLFDLGVPRAAGFGAFANGINNAGVVLGGYLNGHSSPFIWQDGFTTLLETAGATATAINDDGLVVGFALHSDNQQDVQACVWRDTQVQFIFSDAENPFRSDGLAISGAGHVTGFVDRDRVHNSVCFVWDGSAVTLLTELRSGDAINLLGQVLGGSKLWNNGAVTALPDLLALAGGGAWTAVNGRAINNLGQIAGDGVAPDGLLHGFLLSPA